MAIKKQVEIDVDATAAEKALKKFGGTLEDVHGEGVQPLNFAIGELEDRLYEMAAAGDTASAEFKEMAQEVASMKKVIIDVDMELDGMSQTMANKMGGAIGGVSAGFELGIGSMAAFGVESEAVESALLKVQSAMAISQGIQGIREAIPSFKALGASIASTAVGQKALNVATVIGSKVMKALNAVMNANPVFLLVTGITALAGAIMYFASQTEVAEENNNKLNETLKEQDKLISKLKAKAEQRWAQELALLEAQGASEQELHDKRLENSERMANVAKAEMRVEQTRIEERRKIYKQALKEGNSELAKSIKEEIEQNKEKYTQLELQLQGHLNNKILEEEKYTQQLEQENKERHDKWRAWKDKQLGIEREIIDARLALIEDNEERELNILNEKWEQQRADLLSDTDKTQEQKDILLKLWDAKRVQEEDEIRAKYVEKEKKKFVDALPEPLEITDVEGVDPVEEEDIKLGLIDSIKVKWRTKEYQDNLEHFENLKEQSAGYFDAAGQGLQALDDLNTLLTDEAVKKAGANEAAAEAARKKGFERSKKLQMTMAIIQGVQGVMAAFTAGSSMGPAGIVMGPVMAALAAVTAGINVAKIAKMKYEGGGGSGGGGGSVPRAPSVPSPASFNVVGNSGTNQLAETLGEQPPVEAQVVGEKVTTQQSLDRNRINNASL